MYIVMPNMIFKTIIFKVLFNISNFNNSIGLYIRLF